MIRIRIKPTYVTIRIDGSKKQRYASAIHALHVIRVAVVGGIAIEPTIITRMALHAVIKQARQELEAAIRDVL